METYCNDLSPDMKSRCGLETCHAGAHENWYGTWYGGVWLTQYKAAGLL